MFGHPWPMPVESIRGVVEAAIQRASNATGVDFSFLLGTAHRESSFNPTAHAPTSSAAGLFQFTEQTWLATVAEVYANLSSGPQVSGPAAASREAPAAAPQDNTDQAFTQYASARQAERIQAQRELVDMVLRGPEDIDDVAGTSRLTHSMFSSEMLQVLAQSRQTR